MAVVFYGFFLSVNCRMELANLPASQDTLYLILPSQGMKFDGLAESFAMLKRVPKH